jgi:putative protease
MNKPELLLPVGNIESFYAAMRGGADAVYLGLQHFNARGRAANFNNYQFQLLLAEAHQNRIKVYVTLNTVIKNKEIAALLEILWFLSKTRVNAVIIQDWGTFFLLKNYFSKLVIHASTQMANHNSAGTSFSKKAGFERVILARELTMPELTEIQKQSSIETEVFVHGALCYSFSGMCNFSSYLGGAGANRGICAQPCRRFYNSGNDQNLSFSMKDNQLIDFVPELAKIGISSLKVEGRLKSGEYVYTVTQAYHKVIDGTQTISEATTTLKLDLGREKTQWFYGKKVSEAITDTSNTGMLLGTIKDIDKRGFTFQSKLKLEKGNRLRIRTRADSEQVSFKLDNFEQDNSGFVRAFGIIEGLKPGNEVFLAGLHKIKFPNKLKGDNKQDIIPMPVNLKRDIATQLKQFKNDKINQIYVRINNHDWLNEIDLERIDKLIINLKKTDWEKFLTNESKTKTHLQKLWMEFPQFIPEKDVPFYKELALQLSRQGLNQFSLSQISQKELLPKNALFGTNENVYNYNDAAAQFLKNEGAQWSTSPFENEMENLEAGANRSQLIPLYYYPRLFYSRQPVTASQGVFTDESMQQYNIEVINGITTVLPTIPVALFQYSAKLNQMGFTRFLIDLSFETPSKKTIKKLMLKFKNAEQMHPSTTFNFKKGLK